MKRIISLILCVLMLLPCIAIFASAEEEEVPFESVTKNASAKASSSWNYYSAPKYAADGVIEDHFWELGGYCFWRPSYSGRDPSINPKDTQYIELSFTSYYEINELLVYASVAGTTFTAKALVLGDWVTFATNTEIEDYPIDEDLAKRMADKQITSIDAKIVHLTVPEDLKGLTTRKIRIEVSGYTAWSPPLVYDIDVMARPGEEPLWDVPDGAYMVTNAALSNNIVEASSSMRAQYPYLATDISYSTFWAANSKTGGEWIAKQFDAEYKVSEIALNFGAITLDNASSFDITVEVLKGDTWEPIAENMTVTPSTGAADSVNIPFSGEYITISGLKVIFNNTNGGNAALTEMVATIYDDPDVENDEKCVFLADYLSEARKQSIAGGNLACFGSVYASSNFDKYAVSSVDYLTDGLIADDSFSWFAQTPEKDVYCGVTLKEEHSVNKIVLYFNDPIVDEDFIEKKFYGKHVLSFDIQAKVDGEFKTVASGTSFNEKNKEYIVSFELSEAVATDDIRVVFKSNAGIFPYLKELEVYEEDYVYPHFDGMVTSRSAKATTTSFAPATYADRAEHLKSISPKIAQNPAVLSIKDISALLYA
ncbi:MAG: discoidin domain-containing protein [Clostridia bacterium]|nr:discoidin domain-containing protein [Clostridia bacterium]